MSNDNIDTALVFSAGLGTRMRPLTNTTPKPLIEVAGKPLLFHVMDALSHDGIAHYHVNTCYLSEQIDAALATRPETVTTHYEPGGPYDTGGGLKAIEAKIEAPVLFTANSDAIFVDEGPVDALRAAWRDEFDVVLALVSREDAIGYTRQGDFFLDGDVPRWRVEGETAPYVYSGTQLIRKSVIHEIDEPIFSLTKLWRKLIGEGRLGAVVISGRWLDIGEVASLPLAEEVLTKS